MTQAYRLESSVGADRETDLDDIWALKKDLSASGHYKEPEYGMTPYPDQALFDAIKDYQRQNGLQTDGVMLPDGETERHMLDNLAVKSPTMWCKHCGGPHAGLHSPKVCWQCWDKGLR